MTALLATVFVAVLVGFLVAHGAAVRALIRAAVEQDRAEAPPSFPKCVVCGGLQAPLPAPCTCADFSFTPASCAPDCTVCKTSAPTEPRS